MNRFVLAVLATVRLSIDFTLADGPFDLYARTREYFGADKQENWFQRGIGCPNCASFWIALGVCQAAGLKGWLNWLAVAGAAMIIHYIILGKR